MILNYKKSKILAFKLRLCDNIGARFDKNKIEFRLKLNTRNVIWIDSLLGY